MFLKDTANIDPDLAGATGIAFRRARVEDAHTIARHRQLMFLDMGYHEEAHLSSIGSRFLPWIKSKLKSGDYLGWLAVDENDRVVAGAGLWLMESPAQSVPSKPMRGNILDVYTEPAFRRQGLARWLVEAALHACKVNNADVVLLHTSKGRSLYEQFEMTA